MKSWVHYVGDPLPDGIEAPKELLGGKAASLQDLREAGLPVPPAFVISVDACEFFLEHEGAWPPELEAQVKANLARLESETERQFGQGSNPLLVSVRSGAAISMPGMMDTLLNVGLHREWVDSNGGHNGWPVFLQFIRNYSQIVFGMDISEPGSQDANPSHVESALLQFEEEAGAAFPDSPWKILENSINAVFRSWNSERAIQYRRRHRIEGLKGTAVTIQAMFPSRASGIVFTQDPTDPNAERMVIEASYGLGEAVVSGGTDPDRFVVRREDLGILESTPGRKTHVTLALRSCGVSPQSGADLRSPILRRDAAATIRGREPALGEEAQFDADQLCLSEQELHQLCELSLRVEKHFGLPVDIEFGFTESELSLLQARPIRGLDVARDSEIGRHEEIQRLKTLSTRPKTWVAHNIGETLRFPTPLTWDFIRFFMSGAGGFGKMYRDLGYVPSNEVMADGFLELICGRIYTDPDRLAGLFWDDLPMVYDRDQIRSDPKVLDQGPQKFDPDRVDAGFLLKVPQAIRSVLKSSRATKQGLKTCQKFFEVECLPPFLEYVRNKREQNLTSMSTEAVLAELDERKQRVLGEFAAESLKPGFFGGLALDQLTQLLGRLDVNDEGQALAFELTLCADDDITLEQDALLSRVAGDEADMQEFLDRFGHRCVGEMELMEPRWREAPDYLERLTESLRGTDFDPTEIHRKNSERRERALQELPEKLAEWGGSSFLEEAIDLAEKARRLLPYRESGKYYLMMGYELIRLAILELSRRWGIGSDLFFLEQNELKQFEGKRGELLDAVKHRKLRWQSLQRLDMPVVIDSSELDDLGRSTARVSSDTNRLEGSPVSPGVAEGTAEVVFDPREFDARKTGYILVCPSTDPAWTPLFVNARGLIVERGGILSHGAIVARDFGIPAVVCADATSSISADSLVRIDGTHGWVDLMEGN
jgi:phosphohistidine swiveling domain-containing protein